MHAVTACFYFEDGYVTTVTFISGNFSRVLPCTEAQTAPFRDVHWHASYSSATNVESAGQ